MEEEISITKSQLRAAFLYWEQEHRKGNCIYTYEESRTHPIERVVDDNVEFVWARLQARA